jgi:hypothetical protein
VRRSASIRRPWCLNVAILARAVNFWGRSDGPQPHRSPDGRNVTKQEDRPSFRRSQVVCLRRAVRGKGLCSRSLRLRNWLFSRARVTRVVHRVGELATAPPSPPDAPEDDCCILVVTRSFLEIIDRSNQMLSLKRRARSCRLPHRSLISRRRMGIAELLRYGTARGLETSPLISFVEAGNRH